MSETRDFVEIHNHLLPGVDDGSRSLEETTRHLRGLAADGVRRLAFSPHLFGFLAEQPGRLEARLRELRRVYEAVTAELRGRDDVPRLQLGQELLLTTPESVAPVLSVDGVGHAGSRYVLIEFGFELPEGCVEIIRAVREHGRRPVIAHPERYRRDGGRVALDEIVEWKQAGALLQVNAGSLAGRYQPDMRQLAWDLLAEGLPDLIGSDNHADSRPQSPLEADRLLRARDAAEHATLLLNENPNRLLDDLDLLAVPPVPRRAAA